MSSWIIIRDNLYLRNIIIGLPVQLREIGRQPALARMDNTITATGMIAWEDDLIIEVNR